MVRDRLPGPKSNPWKKRRAAPQRPRWVAATRGSKGRSRGLQKVVMGLAGSFLLIGTVAVHQGAVKLPGLPSATSIVGAPEAVASSSSAGVVRTYYDLCRSPPHNNCVIDGDTFYHGRQSIRVADIDTPETRGAQCQHEAQLGDRATRRFQQLLNAGPFVLHGWGSRDEDRYGRKLRVVVRDGRSLGDILVAEGLARTWGGRREPWC